MITRANISQTVGRATNQKELITADQRTSDIINQIIKNHYANLPAAKKIASRFDAPTVVETGRNIWDFLKKNIEYRIEPAHKQTTKTIQRFMQDGFGDCKHLSNFTGTILHALGIPFAYRFVSFRNSTEPTHVYVVAYDGTKEIPIDAVLSFYNTEKPYTHKIDKKMSLYQLSGIDTLGEIDTMHYIGSVDDEDYYISGKDKKLHLANTHKGNANAKAHDITFTPVTFNPIKTIGCIGTTETYIGSIGDADFYQSLDGIGKIKILKKVANKAKAIVKKVAKPAVKVVKTVAKKTGAAVKKAAVVTAKATATAAKKTGGALKTAAKKTGGAVKKVAKGAVKIVKKTALAVPRTAFRGLVALNFRGWATGLAKANAKNSGEVRKTWEKIGGNYGDLMSAVNSGAKKKRILGIENQVSGIGAFGELGAALATALPIVAIMIPVIKRFAGSEDGEGGNPTPPTDLASAAASITRDVVEWVAPKSSQDTQNNSVPTYAPIVPTQSYSDYQPTTDSANYQPQPQGMDTGKMLLIGGGTLAALYLLSQANSR